jgi:uncharacterized protein YjbI with pentapeptide repeats
MHSHDPNKPQDKFDAEINAILLGNSLHHRLKDRFDFGSFVFFECCFAYGAEFTRRVDFRNVTFTKGANFEGATFTDGADFDDATFIKDAIFFGATFTETAYFACSTFIEEGDFRGAKFSKGAIFRLITFTDGADFDDATFTENPDFWESTFTKFANFSGTTFTDGAHFEGVTFCDVVDFENVTFGSEDALTEGIAIADFRRVQFLKPGLVRFLRTNAQATYGLRARFRDCLIEGVQFDAVKWYRHDDRMVLQDELDILERAKQAPIYEEVAIAYRRLITNFEKARAYDLVEDCTIGEFEMKRRNPDRLPFAKLLKLDYECCPFLRAIGERASIVGIYHLASLYGTSYQRAMGVLGLLLVAFGLCFSTVVDIFPMSTSDKIAACGHLNVFDRMGSGLLHALEVATLQQKPLCEPVSALGRFLEIWERLLVAGQATLLLFALRRRFRR